MNLESPLTYDNNHTITCDEINTSSRKMNSIDVSFENISYTLNAWKLLKFQKETKHILQNISGSFKSGELSVIMGPSGAGKTTLLNVLAGFTTKNWEGTVRYNDTVRDRSAKFRKFCAYISQDNELRMGLTVGEAMHFAGNLKLDSSSSSEFKKHKVIELLDILGLTNCRDTITARLSGGQRKRLAIALELISNPPILFLDEPTTGLDSSSCRQSVTLLKRLAVEEGRTIVCTIHQPTALLFGMFDKLYALANGKCIYDGSSNQFLTHVSSLGITCPQYHNPADFLIEIAVGDHGADDLQKMENMCVEMTSSCDENNSTSHRRRRRMNTIDFGNTQQAHVFLQFLLLFQRNLLSVKRNYVYYLNRLVAHFLIGCLFGYLYRDVGSFANKIFANYIYLYGSLLVVVYTGKMSVTLSFPLEIRILTREHFNRWYKLAPYFLSIISFEISFQIICTLLYVLPSYHLTGQPYDFRFFLFTVFCILSTFCAQSWGYFIGVTIPIKMAVFLGPTLVCIFSIFGFCISVFETPIYFRWIYHISYYRAGFHGTVYSIYGMDRNDLICPEEEVYCPYMDPIKLLKIMDIHHVNLVLNTFLIITNWCLMTTVTYLALWVKLNKR